MTQGYDGRSLDGNFVSVLDEAIRSRIVEVHTAMPGEITAFDPATQTATVQLCLQREVLDKTEPISELRQVPVMLNGGGGFYLTFPLEAGTPCLVVFSERGIDNWVRDAGCQPQFLRRTHHLSDAICIPGLRSPSQALSGYDTQNVTLRTEGGQSVFCMTPDGRFALSNGTEELLSIIGDLLASLIDMQAVVTSGSSAGSYAHDQIVELTDIRQRLQQLTK